jgi:hypothetical protein
LKTSTWFAAAPAVNNRPAAREQLTRICRTPRTRERVVVNAIDTYNLLSPDRGLRNRPEVRINAVESIDELPNGRSSVIAGRLDGKGSHSGARHAGVTSGRSPTNIPACRYT